MNIIRRMMKITRNIHCGGAQTNINRLRFEKKISPDDVLKRAGYDVVDKKVYANNECIGLTIPQHSLYKELLKP